MVEDDPFGGVLYNFGPQRSKVPGSGCLPFVLIVGLILLPLVLIYFLFKFLIRTYTWLVVRNPFGFDEGVAPLYYLILLALAVTGIYVVAALTG